MCDTCSQLFDYLIAGESPLVEPPTADIEALVLRTHRELRDFLRKEIACDHDVCWADACEEAVAQQWPATACVWKVAARWPLAALRAALAAWPLVIRDHITQQGAPGRVVAFGLAVTIGAVVHHPDAEGRARRVPEFRGARCTHVTPPA